MSMSLQKLSISNAAVYVMYVIFMSIAASQL